MIGHKTAYYRYLPGPLTAEGRKIGLYVLDAGYTLIPAGSPYPPSSHDKEHNFDTDSGRVLSEYQIVYITRGRGFFETAAGRMEISAGSAFILFPGVWHRYAPDPQTGWDEYWVGFKGETAKRLMSSPFLSPDDPVIQAGHDEKLLHLFIETAEALETEMAGGQLLTAAWTIEIIARLRTAQQGMWRSSEMEELVRRARCRLQEMADRNVSIPDLAAELHIGYSLFRKTFTEYSGVSPAQYHLQQRIQKACELLASTDRPVSRIADDLGFCSPYYFSRLFTAKTGKSPRAFRSALRL